MNRNIFFHAGPATDSLARDLCAGLALAIVLACLVLVLP